MLVGGSKITRQVNSTMAMLGKNRVAPVLIQGPTGVGKERAARLYYSSMEGRLPFIGVNVASLSDGLFESSLFGHVRGAYTGAHEARGGFLQEAGEGVLFLDEIGIASKAVQAGLLRVLEESEYFPVGAAEVKRFRGRLLFASSRDLGAQVRAGRLLADLYHRISREVVWIPSLAKRRQDVPALVEYFLNRLSPAEARRLDLPRRPRRISVTAPAMNLLQSYDYPGNVRELIHVLGRIVRRLPESRNVIRIHSVREELSERKSSTRPIEPLDQQVRKYALHALSECEGNQTRAASALQISRARLRRILGRVEEAPAQG